jgi:hypothetical protein
LRGVGVRVVEVDRLLIIGCGMPVIHQDQVGPDPVAEPLQLKTPVLPPARYFFRNRIMSRGAKKSSRRRRRAVGVTPFPGAS